MTDFRPATDAEILEAHKYDIANGRMVRYRHGVMEGTDRRTLYGVMHRQYSRSRLRVQDGAAYVRHHGRIEKVVATVFAGPETGRDIVWDLRVEGTFTPRR